jgi:type I restriction enzyme, S subunit
MTRKPNPLRAFASSREPQNEEATPALVPKLRFPEFRDAEGWAVKPFDDLFTIGNGRDYKHLEAGDVPVYGSGGYMLSVNDYLHDGESVCIGRKGTIDNPMFLTGRFWTVDTLFYTHSFKDCLPKFIFAIFQQIDWLKHNEAGGVPSLSKTNIQKICTAVPSPSEQQKIAECLSSVDELIAAQARKVDALKTHKKGLMQQLFPSENLEVRSEKEGDPNFSLQNSNFSPRIPRLRFPEFQNAGEWEVKALADIVQVASGQVDPTESPYSGFPQIGSENIESNTGKLVNVKSAAEKGVISGNYLFDEHDVLYSKIRPALNKAAAPDFTGICSADIYPIRPANEGLLRSYLLYLLLSDKFLEHAIRSSDRGKIPKINREDLLGYVAAIPKPAEQQRIATCLSSLDALITAETQKHEALKTHKKGLLQNLFPSEKDSESENLEGRIEK